MSQVKITVRKNGSLRVDDPNGVVEMVDADGNQYDLTGKTAFSLCRCGASANRPFCDGSHNTIAFQAPDTAIKIG
jgi:CDGSH-type Zn-finger protein